jgi:hypothetical protein
MVLARLIYLCLIQGCSPSSRAIYTVPRFLHPRKIFTSIALPVCLQSSLTNNFLSYQLNKKMNYLKIVPTFSPYHLDIISLKSKFTETMSRGI